MVPEILVDPILRAGIRIACRRRLRRERRGGVEAQERRLQAWVEELRRSPIAIETAEARPIRVRVL